MRKLRALDKGLLLALALGFLAAWPFWSRPGLPQATDAELHIYRTAELGYSLREGILYPRWAPDFYYGHGYPIFNYYAPFTYHLANWLTGVQPEMAVVGVKRVFILAHLLGAVGAYLLGREYGQQRGGLLAAASFAFSPYVVLINPHIRGVLAESFAVSLIPLTLWLWERLWRGGGRWVFTGAVLSAAVTLLSHNLTGLSLLALLVLFSLWQGWVLGRKQYFGRALAAGLLVALVTAFFLLPFILERSYIRLNVTGEGHYDFRGHFVRWQALFSPLRPLDWAATAPQVPMSAGFAQLLLALSGLIWWGRSRLRGQWRALAWYALGTALLILLILPASTTLWERLPGLEFYQFPWRFLGPLAALWIPLIAGWGYAALRSRWALGGVLALLLLASLPGLYPHPWPAEFGDLSRRGMIDFELLGRARGTTSTDDFIPTTVDVIPLYQESVLASYQNPPVDRVNRHTLPEGATVTIVEQRGNLTRFDVAAPEAFTLRLYQFAFPGWRVYVDGIEVETAIARPEGFLTTPIPAGSSEVVVRFQDTPARRWGWGIALVGLLGLLVAWLRLPRSAEDEATTPEGECLWGYAVLLAAFALFKVGVGDTTPWFHYTSPPGVALPVQTTQTAEFGDQLKLFGFDVVDTRLSPGDTLWVTLYWAAQQPLSTNYQVFVHLIRPEGTIWTQSDHLNPGGFPTSQWPVERYVWDEHRLPLPPDLPPGEYQLSVGVYLLAANERLPVRSASWGQRADHVLLEQIIYVGK